MDYNTLNVSRIDPWYTLITIDRESAMNALNIDVLTELCHVVAELELDDAVRVVAITGAGKAFVAGADVASMREMNATEALAFAEQGGQLGDSIENSNKLYVAAVNGFALGGGCELAMCCDVIYASDRAKLGQPEVKLGVIPGFGGTQRLSRRVGIGKAIELCVTGDMVDAPTAQQIGLVEHVVAGAELMDTVQRLAKRVADNGPLAVSLAKRVVREGFDVPLSTACRVERLAFAGLFDSADQTEGMTAFLDKRPPRFQGQ